MANLKAKQRGWDADRLGRYLGEKHFSERHPDMYTPGEQDKLNLVTEYLRNHGPGPVRHPDTRKLMWLIWHRECGDIAFCMTENPRRASIKSTNVIYPGNWGAPEPDSEMICYSCRERIKKQDLLETPPPRKRLIVSGVTH